MSNETSNDRMIQDLLARLQAESVNEGGCFDWVAIPNPNQLPASACLIETLEAMEVARHAMFDTRKQRHKYSRDRAHHELHLQPWNGGLETVWVRLEYWSRLESLFHIHPVLTEEFWLLLPRFESLVTETLTAAGLMAIWVAEDNRALHALVSDHLSEDIVFETKQGLFLLHFGISS